MIGEYIPNLLRYKAFGGYTNQKSTIDKWKADFLPGESYWFSARKPESALASIFC